MKTNLRLILGLMEHRIAVIYALYEKDASYVENIAFFLKHAVVTSDDRMTYVLVVNGESLKTDPELARLHSDSTPATVIVVKRANTGFDFGGFQAGLVALDKVVLPGGRENFSKFIFINSSCRGLFIPPHVMPTKTPRAVWADIFTSQLSQTVRLVGPTINILIPDASRPKSWGHSMCKAVGASIMPHVQSYAFAVDKECLAVLVANKIFGPEYPTITDAIVHQEIPMSLSVLRHDPSWTFSLLCKRIHWRKFQGRRYDAVRKLGSKHSGT